MESEPGPSKIKIKNEPKPKIEYDSAIGGFVNLPEHLPTFRYATGKVNEITSLLDAIRNPNNCQLIFQTLPKRMRRRAMSHHPKRLPRKYRGIHKAQMAKSGPIKINKRPSRKFRRKPSNLLKDYLRRQKKNIWLETHIWHAKRFHMINKWGYRLAYSSCDKTFRACHRAVNSNCLIQDISYLACIQLEGSIVQIKDGFSRITSNECGLGICAKAYLNGKREGSINLFKMNKYPNCALGKVDFIWEHADKKEKKLWLFVHPSGYQDVLIELIKSFALKSTKQQKFMIDEDGNEVEALESTIYKETTGNLKTTENIKTEDKSLIEKCDTPKISIKKSVKKLDQIKFVTKTFAFKMSPSYKNVWTGIILTELRDTINRFRLTGPLSQAILTQALICKKERFGAPFNWFKTFMGNEENRQSHQIQTDYWANCRAINSPSQLIPNIVVALNIVDTRLNRPTKRTKTIPENLNDDSDILFSLPESLASSAIWDSDIRNNLVETMMSNHDLCTLRNRKLLIPGEPCSFEEDLQPIPILLIQRPGSQVNNCKKLGYGSGWDIILPAGYGMNVWLSLIMWGARPGGLRETSSIFHESGKDEYFPDTPGGRRELAERSRILKERYLKLPPNKHCNYAKLGICSPFKFPIERLTFEWEGIEDYYVLRNSQLLHALMNSIWTQEKLPPLPTHVLIQISITMKTRGNPGDLALICLPEREDFKKNQKLVKKYINDPIYVEPLHIDPFETRRKTLRLQHKQTLKRLRARRVRDKKKAQETSKKRVIIRPPNTEKIIVEYFTKISQMLVPEDPGTVRYQCSRQVIGYMIHCSFSLVEGTVTGVGYVTSKGLRKLIDRQKEAKDKLVFVRGRSTRNYRFANFNINCQN